MNKIQKLLRTFKKYDKLGLTMIIPYKKAFSTSCATNLRWVTVCLHFGVFLKFTVEFNIIYGVKFHWRGKLQADSTQIEREREREL